MNAISAMVEASLSCSQQGLVLLCIWRILYFIGSVFLSLERGAGGEVYSEVPIVLTDIVSYLNSTCIEWRIKPNEVTYRAGQKSFGTTTFH